jgi:hypothetical protein
MEKFMALLKSLILRAMVIYFIMSFIRGNGSGVKTPVANTDPAGGKAPSSLASSNIYTNGTEFVRRV